MGSGFGRKRGWRWPPERTVTGEGEDLGTPQRTELADGEDLAIGRPRLGCPPVATQVDGLPSSRAQASPGSGRSSDVTVWLTLRRRPGWHAAYGRFRRQACNPRVVRF